MGLNIKNREVERLAAEVAEMAHETKTEAIRKALEDRKEQLKLRTGGVRMKLRDVNLWLESEVWPKVPPEILGKGLSKEEEEEILGFGAGGV